MALGSVCSGGNWLIALIKPVEDCAMANGKDASFVASKLRDNVEQSSSGSRRLKLRNLLSKFSDLSIILCHKKQENFSVE